MSEPVRPKTGNLRWRDVDVRAYKQEPDVPYRDVTRQVLFDDPALASQLRYFEVAPGGYTTLERHEHAHAVVIQRGRGRVLVGERVFEVREHDLVHVPALAWHQFRAAHDAPLGFLCMVNATRDRPQLPTPDDLARLCTLPAIAAFLGG
ncbi:MAG: cupin domain-containing protein [Betaproteobacteria bacterium]|nr:cupin domain-containing protein [Betaproteobacteria bacterium]